MMSCETKFLNWDDIRKIIYSHFGINDPEKQRTHCEMLLYPENIQVKYNEDNVLELRIYDKSFSERIKEHTNEL